MSEIASQLRRPETTVAAAAAAVPVRQQLLARRQSSSSSTSAPTHSSSSAMGITRRLMKLEALVSSFFFGSAIAEALNCGLAECGVEPWVGLATVTTAPHILRYTSHTPRQRNRATLLCHNALQHFYSIFCAFCSQKHCRNLILIISFSVFSKKFRIISI